MERQRYSHKPSSSKSGYLPPGRGRYHKNYPSKVQIVNRDKQLVTNETSIQLVSNAYSLSAIKSNRAIYQYELIITAGERSRDLPASILTRNFVLRTIRKILINEFVPLLLESDVPAGIVVIEPKSDAIFTTERFKLQVNESDKTESILYKNVLVENELMTYRLEVDIFIKFARIISLENKEHVRAIMSTALHHQLLLKMLKYGTVYYFSNVDHTVQAFQDNRLDLISGHTMGISLSGVKFSLDNQSIVVINCPHAYITGPHRLIDLLASYLEGKPTRGIELNHSLNIPIDRLRRLHVATSITGSEEWFGEFCGILEGFKCGANFGSCNLNIKFSLSDLPATHLTIENSEQQNITVQEHFARLGLNLNYPNLPCLKTRDPEVPYVPFELCTLLPGQKVPIFRLSSIARGHLSQLNKPRPSETKRNTEEARNELVAICKDELQHYGIEISSQPIRATGRSLGKPTLQFRDQSVKPRGDFWESGVFCQPVDLESNWCIVDTAPVDSRLEDRFFTGFKNYCVRYGFLMGCPHRMYKAKQEILDDRNSLDHLIGHCKVATSGRLKFIMFVIDSNSTSLNRMIHLTFDDNPNISAACLRVESIMNERRHTSIYRTLVHKLNARLGGTNVTYHKDTLSSVGLKADDLMIVGLDVTHPDNELSGVSIVGCAYTYSNDLFKHKSLVWPQTARMEIIAKMDVLMKRLLYEYYIANNERLPRKLIVYRDGVSHEEFDKVRAIEITKARAIIEETAIETNQQKPELSYIIAQKRHTMRFFKIQSQRVENPPGGTLIDEGIVTQENREFYLYANTNPQATARPIHYHVLLEGLEISILQKLTYYLCFNFGKCSGSLSMPSSLRYAHNAAYDARNRVIAAKEFSENSFYTSKFFC